MKSVYAAAINLSRRVFPLTYQNSVMVKDSVKNPYYYSVVSEVRSPIQAPHRNVIVLAHSWTSLLLPNLVNSAIFKWFRAPQYAHYVKASVAPIQHMELTNSSFVKNYGKYKSIMTYDGPPRN